MLRRLIRQTAYAAVTGCHLQHCRVRTARPLSRAGAKFSEGLACRGDARGKGRVLARCSALDGAMDHSQHPHGQWVAAAHATIHCSIGCILGETLGLILGTQFGFSQIASMAVSTCLAYLSGFSLAVFPL